MQRAELYLDYAAECLKLAARISEPAHRQRLIALAADWCDLAEVRIRQHQRQLGAEEAWPRRLADHMDFVSKITQWEARFTVDSFSALHPASK
jgi:hypothetical protein